MYVPPGSPLRSHVLAPCASYGPTARSMCGSATASSARVARIGRTAASSAAAPPGSPRGWARARDFSTPARSERRAAARFAAASEVEGHSERDGGRGEKWRQGWGAGWPWRGLSTESEEHQFESKADAGASKTYPQQAGAIRKNGYLVIKNRPYKFEPRPRRPRRYPVLVRAADKPELHRCRRRRDPVVTCDSPPTALGPAPRRRQHLAYTTCISDEGGGIPRSGLPRIFTYLYSTAENPPDLDGHNEGVTMAGYGYGIPISRLYARYFGGDLQIISMEGYGTDAYLHLSRLGNSEEPLP